MTQLFGHRLSTEIQARINLAMASAKGVSGPRLSDEARARVMPSGICPSAIPVTIVCGPPASGKSTYVLERARPDDLVIDLDEIIMDMSGRHGHCGGRHVLPEALERRNQLLRGLAHDKQHRCAWFIICAADSVERAQWALMLGATIKILATPLNECIRRIKADPGRSRRRASMISGAQAWWALNPQMKQQGSGVLI